MYHLSNYLYTELGWTSMWIFNYISFRSILALILSLTIALVFGKKIIEYIQRKQIGETVRDLGLEGQLQKTGTPTMGGIIILICILIPTLLFCNLKVQPVLMVIAFH